MSTGRGGNNQVGEDIALGGFNISSKNNLNSDSNSSSNAATSSGSLLTSSGAKSVGGSNEASGHAGLTPAASHVDPYWYKVHDIFNLISIPIVAIPNFIYVSQTRYFGDMPSVTDHLAPGYVDSDGFYHILHWLFVAYLVIDAFWVIFRPRSVPAPTMIVLHHIISLLGWSMPLLTDAPYLRKWTTLAMMVEANTFFLILRRNVPGRQNAILDYLFLITWVVFRIIAYLYITFFYPYYYYDEIFCLEINASKMCYSMVIFLDIMNAQWTADLLLKYDVAAMLTRKGRISSTSNGAAKRD